MNCLRQSTHGLFSWPRAIFFQSRIISPRTIPRFNARSISTSPVLHRRKLVKEGKENQDRYPIPGTEYIKSLLTLPREPPIPKLPAPYFEAPEFYRYIWPLYSRRWSLNITDREHSIQDGELHTEKFITPSLIRRFFLFSPGQAQRLVDGLLELVEAEKHEPQVRFYYGLGRPRAITVQTFTLKSKRLSGYITPGITLLDVRLAIQLEKLYYSIVGEPSEFHVIHGTPMHYDKVVKEHARARGHLRRTLPFRRPASTEEVQALDFAQKSPVLPPMKKPHAFCTDEDFSNTIVPLYACGWNVVYKIRYQRISGNAIPMKIPSLTGFYKFTSFRTAMFFAEDVTNILRGGLGYDIFVSAQTVTVQPLSQEKEQEISLCDARSAVLVEKLFQDRYRTRARDSPARAMLYMVQPTSREDLKLEPFSFLRSIHLGRVAKASKVPRRHIRVPRENQDGHQPH